MQQSEQRWRSRGATCIAVVVTLMLTAATLLAWTDYAFSDSAEFSRRAVAVLDSAAVREEIAEEIADALVQATPEAVAFRSVLIAVAEDVIDTDAFKTVFRTAVEEAHKVLFSNAGQQVLVNLSESVAVISTTLQIINPSVAANLSPDTANVIVDISDKVQSLHLLQIGHELSQLGATALLIAVGGMIAIVALETRRQRGVFKLGIAVLFAGILVVGVTFAAPAVAAMRFRDPIVAAAIGDATFRFVSDLRTLGFWLVACGVIVVTLGSAVAPQGDPITLRSLGARLETLGGRWRPSTPTGQVIRGFVFIGSALALIFLREAIVPMAVALVGAYVGYLGLFQILKVVAPQTRAVRLHPGEQTVERVVERSRANRGLALVGLTIAFLFVATAGFGVLTLRAHRDAVAAAEIECNGATDLCDRPLDQVVFPASHNSMSAASEPGWLFAENLTGIPNQLEYGIRTFLVKSHYGRPSGVRVGGAEIVVTDKQAETAARPQASEDEIGPAAFARAQQISSSVPQPTVQKEVYLCHVFCELGAVKFSDTLTAVKQFVTRYPNEVIIFIIGDFVTRDDTDAVFQQVGLADRRWDYDPSQPLPTLRDLIENRHNIVVMSENSGQPPAWNIDAYQQLVQDTPFTFAQPSDFNCNTNRGPATAALFQINHWITNNQPPNIDRARQVNAYDVLMPRVRQCQQDRGKLPNIVGVNFYDQGDLLRVVDELNGVTADRP